MRYPVLGSTLLCLCLSACSDDASGGGDTGDASGDTTADTSPDATGDASEDVLPDTGDDTADAVSDASDELDVAPDQSDASDDAGDVTADGGGDAGDASGDAALCDYLDLDYVVLQCGEGPDFFSGWTDLNGNTEECPDYWTSGSLAQYDSLEEAAEARECSIDCIYRASTAVMFLHCGHRDEYISYDAEGEECPTLLQFQTGFFDGIGEYREDSPCDCGADQFLLEWPTNGYIVDFTVSDGTENGYIWVTGETGSDQVAAFVAGDTESLGVPGGTLQSGGLYNPGYSYSFVPETVSFSGAAIEGCDRTACFVEDEWPAWLEDPGTWCPSTFEPLGIYDCSGGDGEFCEQVWPL